MSLEKGELRLCAQHDKVFLHELLTPGRPWWDPDSPQFVPDDAVVHGQYHLPPGYSLAFVPLEAAVELGSADQASRKLLASSYNLPKLVITFIQAMWGLITLYRTRGDQIQIFGYAAFGLTVTPYAFMSIMNIIGSLLNPEYGSIFLVRTPLMDEAGPNGGFFLAEVCSQAARSPEHPYQPPRTIRFFRFFRFFRRLSRPVKSRLLDALDILIGCIPLAVIGALSSFQPQSSSALQRGFTMSWVVMGILGGPIVRSVRQTWGTFRHGYKGVSVACVTVLYYGAPAIGGMVVVGKMIQDYGVCRRLT